MKQLNDFIAFLKKNRVIIYVILGLAFMLQVCSYGAKPTISEKDTIIENIVPLSQNIQLPEALDNHTPNSSPNDFNTILFMALIVLGFFVAKRFGYLEKLFPKIVVFRVVHLKKRDNGNLVLKIFLLNKTSNSISFNSPSIEFFNGDKKRAFVIKNIGGLNYFPLTLTPGTGHRFTIDAQKFYTNIADLSEYKVSRMVISTTSGKKYSSIKWPLGLTFRKI